MIKFVSFFCLLLLFSCSPNNDLLKPNIIIIYVDDLGYGDLGCYGAVGIETPNIDKLASGGLRFTDAHCGAATCTPSRYTLLTGSYAFRNDAAILPGDAPLLISPETPTLASMLKSNGYKTGVIGKWHLGLGKGSVDWNNHIKPGPNEIGFDYSFLIPATGDRVPTVYVENQKVIGLENDDPIEVNYKNIIGNLPTGSANPEMLKQLADPQHSGTIINGISRIGYMAGGEKAQWVDEEFPDILTSKTEKFIEQNKGTPFFLYLAYHDIHVPRVPNERFIGKSIMGPRGDAIAQMDWCTGQVIEKLDSLGIIENTIVIFTSDNGPVLNDGYEDQSVELLGKHNPSGTFRGGKYSIFEAGTRVPTIVYWPGTIKPAVSDVMWSQVDIYNSIANLINHPLNENEAPDSFNMLNSILGKSNDSRPVMLEEAYSFAIRKNKWKYIKKIDGLIPAWIMNDKNIEGGLEPFEQLYDLESDISEQINLAEKYPAIVDEMKKELDMILQNNKTRK